MQQNTAENTDKFAAAHLENDSETRAFSKRLNAAKEKWRAEYEETLFARLAVTDPRTGTPITDSEQLIALLNEQETATAAEEDPQVAALQAELTRYRDAEEDRRLAQDARLGSEYLRLRDEVQRLADYARGKGKILSRTAAFHAVLLQHLDEMLDGAGTRGGEAVLAQIRANERATPQALGGTPVQPRTDYRRMSDEEFGHVLQRALNGELRRSNNGI